jgi:hypothetical protein
LRRAAILPSRVPARLSNMSIAGWHLQSRVDDESCCCECRHQRPTHSARNHGQIWEQRREQPNTI